MVSNQVHSMYGLTCGEGGGSDFFTEREDFSTELLKVGLQLLIKLKELLPVGET